MSHATDEILRTLKQARERSGLSQRDLGARVGVPQSHLSKIESGGTDLRLSSLVELARALDYELVLVPRELLPAVEAIAGNASSTLSENARRRTSVLNRAMSASARLSRTHPETADAERIAQSLRELGTFHLEASDLETMRRVTDRLMKLPSGPAALKAIERSAKQLSEVRNRSAHAPPASPRPAYSLDEEDDDA